MIISNFSGQIVSTDDRSFQGEVGVLHRVQAALPRLLVLETGIGELVIGLHVAFFLFRLFLLDELDLQL